MMDLSKVILDEEFKPLEELLETREDMSGHLEFLRVLKLCWDQVSQKSQEKDGEAFRNDCLAVLKNFLEKQYYREWFGFLGDKLLDHLCAGPDGSKRLFPERCACHYGTLRSLLRSAHYGEPLPDAEERLEWAYYDFTLLFSPFMNQAATNLSTGSYLCEEHINPSTHKNTIVDLWERKKTCWDDIENVLRSYHWDEEQLEKLHQLFFETILDPKDVISAKAPRGIAWINFLVKTFPERVGPQRWRFRWGRLYSTEYGDPEKVEKNKKCGRNPDRYKDKGNSLLNFMSSIFCRMTDQMNRSTFSIFSLSASPWIDLYKYCSFKREGYKESESLRVEGDRLHNFSLFPSGKIPREDLDCEQENKLPVQTIHMVYAPINAIWETGKLQNAVSFHHFITDWVMDCQKLTVQQTLPNFEELLQGFEFSVEPVPQKLCENKDLLLNLKNFLKERGLLEELSNQTLNPTNLWQDILANGLKNWVGEDSSRVSNMIGVDQEVVSSTVCFQEDKIVRIRTDDDVPGEWDPKANYIVEFTRDNFIAFLIEVACWKGKLNSGFDCSDLYNLMKPLKMECSPNHSRLPHNVIEQSEDFALGLSNMYGEMDQKTKVTFPIIVKRRSYTDDWKLTDKDKEKAQEAIVDHFAKRWMKIFEQEKTQKKFELIHFVIENSRKPGEDELKYPWGEIYEKDNCDAEIALLKKLVFC